MRRGPYEAARRVQAPPLQYLGSGGIRAPQRWLSHPAACSESDPDPLGPKRLNCYRYLTAGGVDAYPEVPVADRTGYY